MIGVIILSLLPQESLPKVDFSYIDLIVHFAMYTTLAYGLSLWLFDRIKDPSVSIWIYPVLLGLFGLFIEVLQKTLPINRFFSWEDAICNFAGACGFYIWVRKIRQ